MNTVSLTLVVISMTTCSRHQPQHIIRFNVQYYIVRNETNVLNVIKSFFCDTNPILLALLLSDLKGHSDCLNAKSRQNFALHLLFMESFKVPTHLKFMDKVPKLTPHNQSSLSLLSPGGAIKSEQCGITLMDGHLSLESKHFIFK